MAEPLPDQDAVEPAQQDIYEAVMNPDGVCPTCYQKLSVEQAPAGQQAERPAPAGQALLDAAQETLDFLEERYADEDGGGDWVDADAGAIADSLEKAMKRAALASQAERPAPAGRVSDFIAGAAWKMANQDASLGDMQEAAEWWASQTEPLQEPKP